ncbi:MAG: hypothetical protein PHF18_09600 [Methanosarcina sp.]|nr:hypothetical protein [Methanosarcina sp.]MDD3247084.1 hypothetical protein [Methanosarcina sp.]
MFGTDNDYMRRGMNLLTGGVAEKIRDFADSCGKPILISSPGESSAGK